DVLQARVDRVLVDERRFLADVGGGDRLRDLAVGRAIAGEELEVVRDARREVELEALVLNLAEAAEVLRRALREEHEEVAAVGDGIERAEVEIHAPVRQLALQAELEGVRDLLREEIADAEEPGRERGLLDARLVEAAAPEAAAPAAVER